MTMTIDDFIAENNVNAENVRVKEELLRAEVRAFKLREVRESLGLTQAELADKIGVGQRQISKIEHGDIENAKVGTIRRYLEAVGGGLSLEYVMGSTRLQVA